MPIGKTKNGDAMKDIFKGISLIVVGLVAAIIVYPFTHELGHSIAAWISGAEIYEFNLFPVPNVVCKFDSMNLICVVFVGFGGVLLPMFLTGFRVPKLFLLWYLWLAIKGICFLSFLVSLWALIFYQTGMEIADDDMTRVLQFAPEYRAIYIAIITAFLAITVVQIARSKPLKKCMKYFGV